MARTCWLPGIALFFLTAFPWYVAVQLRNPEFFRVFILEHNLARFGKDLYHHTQPFWYYLPVALLGLVPWTMFVSAALVETVRAWWTEKKKAVPVGRCLACVPRDLAHRSGRVFFFFRIEAARLHSAGPSGRHAPAGGICSPPRDGR